MITRADAELLRERLLAVLEEDAHNADRLLARLESLTGESGISAHAALLLILTRLGFEEEQARQHWEAILVHRERMSRSLGRDPGVRTALLDYFVNVNRRLKEPTLIDLELVPPAGLGEEDAATGLASDRRLRAALASEIRRSRRYGLRAAVVVVDADHFGEINRRCGELVGDRLLRELATLARANVRDIDLAARSGEDELVLLLPETDRNGALLVAERFRRRTEAHFFGRECGAAKVGMTISAGIASFPDDATTPETLLERAAQALYHAKAAGRNTVHLFHPDRRRYLRFDLEPERFEIEVLGSGPRDPGRARDLSRNGILFRSPEPLEIGEEIELRIAGVSPEAGRSLRLRGRVVRLEELPPDPEAPASGEEGTADGDRYEVGVALDLQWAEGTEDLIAFLERASDIGPGARA
jgi:diguanylate cyclase (GGDEF)-like protein